jgi:FkbM family methyltransferase
MLKRVESLINNSPFYNIIRFNPISELIIETRTRKTIKAIDFYSSFLDTRSSNHLVYDIGANKGNKVKAFLKMGFEVIAVEPERKAISTLKWRFGHNKKVTLLENGVSDKESVLTIHIAANRSGLNTVSDKWVESLEKEKSNRWHKKHDFKKKYEIKAITLDQIVQQYGIPYYIKIDVEGHEKTVLKGLKSLPAFISFETNLPEFLEETIECIQLLTALSDKILFNYSIVDKTELVNWIPAHEMIEKIKDPAFRYMEIIGRS